jgi:tripartite-type tricarboxylate transporter receptor subunit TctC
LQRAGGALAAASITDTISGGRRPKQPCAAAADIAKLRRTCRSRAISVMRFPVYAAGACAIALIALNTPPANAQNWPSRPIRVIVPFPPGGGTDIVMRIVTQKVSQHTGMSFVIDSRPGGTGVLGAELAARAAPDGYTIFTSAPEFSINPSMRKLPYDPLKDFAFITQVTSGQFMVVSHPSLPATSVKQLIALARERPGELNYASSGSGGINHLAGELLQSMTGTKLTHIAYKGTGPAVTALLGGHVHFMFGSTSGLLEPVRSGKLRPIAVTGTRRLPQLPEVPTIDESGVRGYAVTGWYGMYAPAQTPADIIARLQAEIRKALDTADVRESLEKTGNEPVGSTPEAFRAFVQSEIVKWAKVVKAANITAE